MNKAASRRHFRQIRSAIASDERKRCTARILTHLQELPELQSARVVALYYGVGSEVFLQTLHPILRAQNIQVAYPRVFGEDLRLLSCHSLESLSPDAYGVPAPPLNAPRVHDEQLDVILVPGLAFTLDRMRLGQGGGYYDRLLSRPRRRATTVGVAFSHQLASALPCDPHDQSVDLVVTDRGIIR